MGWVSVVISAIIAILKGIFGMDKPRKETLEHPLPDLEVTDGKTDKDRLKDLGL